MIHELKIPAAFLATIVLASVGTTSSHAAYVDAVSTLQPVVHYRFSDVAGATTADANYNGGTAYDATFTATLPDSKKNVQGPQPPAFNGFETGNSGHQIENNAAHPISLPIAAHGAFLNRAIAEGATFQLWYRRQNSSTNPGTFFSSRGDQSPTADLFNLQYTPSTGLVKVFSRAGGASYSGSATAVLPNSTAAGDFHQFTFVVDGVGVDRSIAIYLDGNALPVTISGSNSATAFTAGTLAPLIGGNWDSATTIGGILSTSVVDEFSIYDYKLTPEQVRATYAAAVPEPASLALIASPLLFALRRSRRA